MHFQFDAVIWDIFKPFLPYIIMLLLVDVILILTLRRLGAKRLKVTSTAHETQIIRNLHSDLDVSTDTIIIEPTRTYRYDSGISASNSGPAKAQRI